MIACVNGHEGCLAQLLAAGCRLDIANELGNTAHLRALINQNGPACSAMLAAETERRIIAAATSAPSFNPAQIMRI